MPNPITARRVIVGINGASSDDGGVPVGAVTHNAVVVTHNAATVTHS